MCGKVRMNCRYMAAPLQRLLCTYDLLYELDATTGKIVKKTDITSADCAESPSLQNPDILLEQLLETFTPKLADSIYRVRVAYAAGNLKL